MLSYVKPNLRTYMKALNVTMTYILAACFAFITMTMNANTPQENENPNVIFTSQIKYGAKSAWKAQFYDDLLLCFRDQKDNLKCANFTPNFNLEIIEIEESKLAKSKGMNPHIPVYSFKCIGTEKNIDALFSLELMDGRKTNMKVHIDDDGRLCLREQERRMFTMAHGCGYGESVIFHVESREYSIATKEPIFYAKRKFIPHPLIVKNKSSVSMSCEPLDVEGKSFEISLIGLLPNESVNFESSSMGKKLSFSNVSDENGEISIKYFPSIAGKSRGSFHLTASNSRIEPLVINHYWGDQAFTTPIKYVEPKN